MTDSCRRKRATQDSAARRLQSMGIVQGVIYSEASVGVDIRVVTGHFREEISASEDFVNRRFEFHVPKKG